MSASAILCSCVASVNVPLFRSVLLIPGQSQAMENGTARNKSHEETDSPRNKAGKPGPKEWRAAISRRLVTKVAFRIAIELK